MTTMTFFRAICLAALAVITLLQPALAADTNAAPGAENPGPSYLQLQEQLRDTQLAIDKNRQEAETAAASNSLLLDERFRLMEKVLANERAEQLSGLERSDQMILMAAGGFAVIGLLVLLLAAFLQWNAVNRLAAAAAGLSAAHAPRLLGAGENLLPPLPALEQSSARFLGLMERLEQRVHELEASVKQPQSLSESAFAHDGSNGSAAPPSAGKILAPAAPDQSAAISLLLGKSQTLLKLDKPEAALACLDEVLALDPSRADALVKKGAALERLQRFEEALQCYDRAIAADNTMTMAYLCKGGMFNRLERYAEALACYEQALKRPGKTAQPAV
jgi:tetratricopeptide (TPR) repeat protein